ncbi:MAG: hypothetical protein Kow00108_07750 [Calditrichia bacterium]
MIKRFSSYFLGMNSILVENHDQALIIDPGVFPDELATIKQYLLENGIQADGVMLTHTHGDHISGWYEFNYLPTLTSNLVLNKDDRQRSEDVKFAVGLYKKRKFDYSLISFPTFSDLMENQQSITIGNMRVICLHTPGHSIDSCSLIFPEQSLIVTGDMLVDIAAPYIFYSFDEYQKSLLAIREKVNEYNIQTLAPGHAHFAHGKKSILERIDRELNYIEHLISLGCRFLASDMEKIDLEKHLLDHCTPELRHNDAHKRNIKKFINDYYKNEICPD